MRWRVCIAFACCVVLAFWLKGCFYRFIKDIMATIRKAIPASSSLPPVRNQTIRAIIAAGKTKIMTLAMRMIMIMPIIRRMASAKIPTSP